MSALSRLLPALAVTAVLLIGSTACGGDSDPSATPTAPASASTASSTTQADDPLLATVLSLQKISTDFGTSFASLEANLQEESLDETALNEGAATYEADRTAYLDAVQSVGEQSTGAGQEIETAYAAFQPDARATVQHADDVLAFRTTGLTCSSAAKLSPVSKGYVTSAKSCQEAVAYFEDSTVPELRAYGRGYDRLMDRRIKILGDLTSAGSSPDDTVDLLDDMTGAVEKAAAAYDDFRPRLEAVPDALDAQIGAVRLSETYPALLAAVEARAGASAGSSD